MFTRAANYMKKALSYPSDVLAAAAMVAMVFVTLAVTADVLIRYICRIIGIDPPILGVWDLNYLGFVIIVWGPMAMAALKGSHSAMTFLLERFPRLPRLGLEMMIALVTGVMLGMVSWQLFVNSILLDQDGVRTTLLKLPYAPLGYFAAIACAVMALAFLTGVPEALGKIRKEPESAEKAREGSEGVEKMEKMKGSSA